MNRNVKGGFRLSRLMKPLVLAAAGIAVTSLAACTSTLKTPAQSGTKFADTVAQASMAYVQVNWKGWVIVPKDLYITGTEYFGKGTYGSYTAVMTCSGFVASSTGAIVTAGHCVDANNYYGGKGAILQAMLADFHHANGKLFNATERAHAIAILDANASVEGFASGSPVDRVVHVAIPAVSDKIYSAQVLAVQPFTQGDVALLRAVGVRAIALPIGAAIPESGDNVVAAGYPGDVAAVVDSSTPASFSEGTVSGTETVNGTPFTQTSAQVSPGMSGGPVLNMAGQVVGTVSWAPSGTTVANFMTDVASIRSLLAGNGVNATLSPADKAFRTGLAYYFAKRYHEAAANFSRALTMEPGLTMVQQYQQKAVAGYPNDVNPPNKGTSSWIYILIGAAVLVLLGGGAGVLVLRRRKSGPAGGKITGFVPGPVSGPAPAGPTPEPVSTAPTAMAQPTVPAVQAQPAVQAPSAPEQVRPDVAGAHEAHLFCSNCGTVHPTEAHYCEQCGQPFPTGLPAER